MFERKNNKPKYEKIHAEPLYNPLNNGLNPQKSGSNQKEIWDSGLKIVPVEIVFDHKLLAICNSIQTKNPDDEFSILVKGSWGDNGFILTSDYIIPPQKVSRTSVDYEGDISTYRTLGYNAVIHSHPFASSSFSKNDEEHINTHFDCSILYSLGKFTVGTVSFRLDESRKLKLPISTITPFSYTEPIVGLENIKKSTDYKTDCAEYYTEYYNDMFKM